MSTYLERNKLLDTSVQKAVISGFSSYLKHTTVIWHQIQTAKKEGKNLHAVFFDLANALGSVQHSFLWASLDVFQILPTLRNLVKSYFQDLQLCFTLAPPGEWLDVP